MRRLFALLLVVPLILVMIGCEDEPTEELNPPSAVVLSGATNGTDLVVTWSPSSTSDIDGYRIYRSGTTDPLWEGTATSATLVAPTFGNYSVVAYRDDEESDPEGFTLEVETGTGTIYRLDAAGPSGFGWNLTAGTGQALSFTTTNASQIDIYYDTDETITSASYYGGAFTNVTGIYNSPIAYGTLTTAPDPATVSYTLGESVGLNQTYVLYVKKGRTFGNFIKIEITGRDTTARSITFRWSLQKVDKWRKLG